MYIFSEVSLIEFSEIYSQVSLYRIADKVYQFFICYVYILPFFHVGTQGRVHGIPSWTCIQHLIWGFPFGVLIGFYCFDIVYCFYCVCKDYFIVLLRLVSCLECPYWEKGGVKIN